MREVLIRKTGERCHATFVAPSQRKLLRPLAAIPTKVVAAVGRHPNEIIHISKLLRLQKVPFHEKMNVLERSRHLCGAIPTKFVTAVGRHPNEIIHIIKLLRLKKVPFHEKMNVLERSRHLCGVIPRKLLRPLAAIPMIFD